MTTYLFNIQNFVGQLSSGPGMEIREVSGFDGMISTTPRRCKDSPNTW